MTQAPPTCIFCGAGNTPYEDTEQIGPFIDTERDTGWGDPIYICLRDKCAGQIAMLAGWISADTQKDLDRQIRALRKALHDANSRTESAERRARATARVHA
jgi:hypothetical protein